MRQPARAPKRSKMHQPAIVNLLAVEASHLKQDMQTIELLRDYLFRKASIDAAKVTPDARLEDIGVDSLILIDLMFELEETLNVRVLDVDMRPATVSELTQLFDSLAATQQKTGT
jgi:acyl carrier protein